MELQVLTCKETDKKGRFPKEKRPLLKKTPINLQEQPYVVPVDRYKPKWGQSRLQ